MKWERFKIYINACIPKENLHANTGILNTVCATPMVHLIPITMKQIKMQMGYEKPYQEGYGLGHCGGATLPFMWAHKKRQLSSTKL